MDVPQDSSRELWGRPSFQVALRIHCQESPSQNRVLSTQIWCARSRPGETSSRAVPGGKLESAFVNSVGVLTGVPLTERMMSPARNPAN